MSNVAVKQDNQADWQFLPIKDFAHTTSGGTPRRGVAEYYNGEVPWVKSGDLNDSHLNKADEYITELGLEKSSAKLFKPGTLLIALYGATIGRLSILNFEASTNQAICGISVPENVDVKYLFYYLLSIRQKLIDQGKGGAQPNINQQIVKETEVPLAPLEQQKRIVSKIEVLFSHIDVGVEALKKAKQLLKQYRQSVLKAAVTGELTKEWREANKDKLEPASQLLERILAERENDYSRKLEEWGKELAGWKAGGQQGKKPAKPQKIKVLNDITDSNISSFWSLPKNWCWIKLGNLAVDVFDGPFGSNLKSNDYVEEGVRVIRLENIGSLEFKDEKVTYITEKKYEALKKHTVSTGDIIFSSFVADGTRVVVLPENIEKAINKADCFCVRAFGDSINAVYLAHFLSTTSTYKRLENQVHGATRPRINTTQLKELEVPLCSNREQMEIVRLTGEKCEAIARLETELDHQLIKTEKNKQSILASAYSGSFSHG
jgi:type I restriction enzyme, S subunit